MRTRLIGLAMMVIALVAGAFAVATVGWGIPETNVLVGFERTDRVDWVLPGSPEWRNGVRPGQRVSEQLSGTTPQTWRLITTDGERSFATSYLAVEATLRGALPLAAISACLGVVSFLFVRRMFLSTAIAAIALALSAQALLAAGMPGQSSAAVAASFVAVAGWHVLWARHDLLRKAAIVLSTTAIVGIWLYARFLEYQIYDVADFGRQLVLLALAVGMLMSLADRKRWRGRLAQLDSSRVADLVALAAVLAVLVVVAIVTEVPLLAVALLGIGALLLYPRLRRRISSTIDDVLLGQLRSDASLRAVEEERGRIARDLHDEPLQEIAAVIRELERRGGTEHEADVLRSAAAHLRRLTVELRPPVLDDLGLAAAAAYVVEQAMLAAPQVEFASRIGPADPFAQRPPADVELAVFRIVQESVENATRHANARTIWVSVDVQASEVTASVEDDGQGLASDAQRQALKAGHVGLASMTQRAALINASFDIRRRHPTGTAVRVQWQAIQ